MLLCIGHWSGHERLAGLLPPFSYAGTRGKRGVGDAGPSKTGPEAFPVGMGQPRLVSTA